MLHIQIVCCIAVLIFGCAAETNYIISTNSSSIECISDIESVHWPTQILLMSWNATSYRWSTLSTIFVRGLLLSCSTDKDCMFKMNPWLKEDYFLLSSTSPDWIVPIPEFVVSSHHTAQSDYWCKKKNNNKNSFQELWEMLILTSPDSYGQLVPLSGPYYCKFPHECLCIVMRSYNSFFRMAFRSVLKY